MTILLWLSRFDWFLALSYYVFCAVRPVAAAFGYDTVPCCSICGREFEADAVIRHIKHCRQVQR